MIQWSLFSVYTSVSVVPTSVVRYIKNRWGPYSGSNCVTRSGRTCTMEKVFKVAVICLLGGIVGLLLAILQRMPGPSPTLGELRNADAKSRETLLLQRPIVYVQGTVEVNGTVDVGNTPLEVEVAR